ncbi:unnamed protein product [Allacma fusca]|uniref:Aminopeptidase n=1 Tax=Allacma fusca TaxID=39272 RepID=A0A8J2P8U6_9HEXA|nr:unnamed protein product [Allacma fusca]
MRPYKSWCLIFCAIVVVHSAPSFTEKSTEPGQGTQEEEERYRLSKDIKPLEYDLKLRIVLDEDPDYTRFTAPGEVLIRVEVAEDAKVPPSSIKIHATATINITEGGINITAENATGIGVAGLERDQEAQTVTIGLENPLSPGTIYDIFIPFVSLIYDGTHPQFGLYRSTYVNDAGETRYIAVTNFETVYTRRMVPCFDEPALKARWNISVIRQKQYHSLSNTNLKTTTVLDDKWEQDTYDTTGLMNTYNVAIAVSDYTSKNATDGIHSKNVAVWAPPALIDAPNDGGKYGADLIANGLVFLDKHLGVPYPFPKLDNFAVNDFFAGAQENWGLNVYRLSRLIYVEGESTIQDKVTLANTAAHELAHQWFGNLVTMKWWDDTWLNEGFSTYFANIAASAPNVYPEYMWEDYVVVDSVQDAMQADARGTTHPLHNVGLLKPEETSSGFGTISYEKGGSVVRMMNEFLTEPIFIAGVREYLKRHQSGNAEQNDLFAALQSIPGVSARLPNASTIKDVLETWTMQTGFPLVRVARSAGNPSVITLTQEKYVNDSRKYSPDQDKWYIPITYETSSVVYNRTKVPDWLLSNETSKVLGGVSPNNTEFLVINPEQTGFYRVLYDNESFNLMLSQLKTDPEKFSFKTRSGILDDYMNFGYAGYSSISNALNLTKYLVHERNLTPWATFFNNMGIANRLLKRTETFPHFSRYLQDLMAPALRAINIMPSSDDQIFNGMLLRNRLVEWSCSLGLTECVEFSKGLVAEWIADPSTRPLTVQPDLRPFVYCTAVEYSTNASAVFDFLLDRYVNLTAEVDQVNLVKALACSSSTLNVLRLLRLALTDNSLIREPHRVQIIQALAGNIKYGFSLVLELITQSPEEVISSLGLTAVSSIVSSLSNFVSEDSEVDKIRSFVNDNRDAFAPIEAALETSILTMESNKLWMENNYLGFRTWLIENTV